MESAALATYLQSDEVVDVVASWLLHTELHCAANRHPDDIDSAAVGVVLDTITLVDLMRGGLLTGGLVGVGDVDAGGGRLVGLLARLRLGVGQVGRRREPSGDRSG